MLAAVSSVLSSCAPWLDLREGPSSYDALLWEAGAEAGQAVAAMFGMSIPPPSIVMPSSLPPPSKATAGRDIHTVFCGHCGVAVAYCLDSAVKRAGDTTSLLYLPRLCIGCPKAAPAGGWSACCDTVRCAACDAEDQQCGQCQYVGLFCQPVHAETTACLLCSCHHRIRDRPL